MGPQYVYCVHKINSVSRSHNRWIRISAHKCRNGVVEGTGADRGLMLPLILSVSIVISGRFMQLSTRVNDVPRGINDRVWPGCDPFELSLLPPLWSASSTRESKNDRITAGLAAAVRSNTTELAAWYRLFFFYGHKTKVSVADVRTKITLTILD